MVNLTRINVIVIIITVIISSCTNNNNDLYWTQIKTKLTSDSILLTQIRSKIYDQALKEVIRNPTADTLSVIKVFFSSLESKFNTEVINDTLYVTYDYLNKISAGPIIEISNYNSRDWAITQIRRGF